MNPQKFKSFFNNFFHFETDYFTVGGWQKNLAYFLKQGNILHHILDRVKFRVFPKLLYVGNFPSHIDIEAASACQMRCPMCYTTYMPNNLKGIMDWDLYKKILDEAIKNNIYSIKLSWRGEPLLNNKLVDMVAYAKDRGIKEVAFLTNAELLTPEIAEKLVNAGLDWMSISADGVDEIYNEIRAPAIFKETIEKVRYMRKYRDDKGFTKPLLRVQSIMSAVENNPEKYYNSWEGVVDRINIISDNVRDFEIKELEHDPYYVCSKPWERMTIAYDGRLHQCNADYSAKKVIGDCKLETLTEIWKGQGFEEVRDAFKHHKYLTQNPACKNCSYGLIREKSNIKVDTEINVSKYKSVEKIVAKNNVRLKTPDDKLTTKIRKTRNEVS